MRRVAAIAILFGMALFVADAEAAPVVGFEEVRIQNGSEPPLVAGIWYPAKSASRKENSGPWPDFEADAPVSGRNLPLVVLSHGGGGSYQSHRDTAIALARAGFVAAAVSHAGDTYDDQSKVMELWRRPAQLHRLITYMLENWRGRVALDGRKIGAFGFSNGGFTVLVAAGGVPDLERVGPYCRAHPDHDLCTAMRRGGMNPQNPPIHVPPHAWMSDERIRAIVVAAPAFGFTFDKRGLSRVRIPVQLWRAEEDRHQPSPYYEDAVRAALPVPPEFHVVPHAGHYDFLPICGKALQSATPDICSDPPSFDRAAFHAKFNAAVVKFFRAHLHG